jgi:crotonobetainyl-CoA:carnitine CoA-transferase CaiB-like acyl-CoA transferase
MIGLWRGLDSVSAMAVADELLKAMWRAVSDAGDGPRQVEFTGNRAVRSAFAATDFAAGSIATAALALSRLQEAAGQPVARVVVDRMLASAWFAYSLRPQGWEPPPQWDPIAGDYEADDGWIRLHTNAPPHRDAALRVLGCAAERDEVSRTVRRWNAEALQEEIVARGGCAAVMFSIKAWRAHPQGGAVASEPLVEASPTNADRCGTWRPEVGRPLRGVRVLDLTRVLAGPVATRFLAGYGADVLRIDPPGWDETIAPEVTLGKRCARLDATSVAGAEHLRRLAAESDVIVHGYRPGVLSALGLSEDEREAIRPGLIDVSLDAYGWTGPWCSRRGFDSLVQMSTGIADRGRIWAASDKPTPLPFQALDQATGYLMAAAAIYGLTVRMTTGLGWKARCSLARTAQVLIEQAGTPSDGEAANVRETPTDDVIEETSWGPAKRVAAPVVIDGAPMYWERPATALGSSSASW